VDYQEYLEEVLSENLLLANPWTIQARKGLKQEDRSPYLDWLADRVLPTTGANHAILDPNFLVFTKLEPDSWQSLLEGFRGQKQLEADKLFRASVDKSIAEIKPKALIDLVVQGASRHGFQPSQAKVSSDEDLEFVDVTRKDATCALRLIDTVAFARRGRVLIQYVFAQYPRKPLALDNFVPGGYLYSEWNKTARLLQVAVHAQCAFVRALRDALQESVK